MNYAAPMVRIEGLSKFFPGKLNFWNKPVTWVKAVNNINLDIYEGETLGVVGESGCGKSTTGSCITRLLDPTGGKIEYLPRNQDTPVDLARLTERELHPYRADIQMVFQDPFSSLNPRMNVRDIISEPLRAFGEKKGPALDDRVAQLMLKVGLRPEYMSRFPHAFSGGQRQRIGIARALSSNPRLVICDESVSSLDVSVQAQTLGLLEDLQEQLGISYMFIAHDLSAVKHISTRVTVMYVGKIFEVADTETLYGHPMHPYTEALLASVPKIKNDRTVRKINLPGEVPDPSSPPEGCFFHPRCAYATPDCAHCVQELRPVTGEEGHLTTCIRAEELSLRGV
ncbi:MAG: ATP-binding cassette domain-containing protein [Treponema sp.]|jgi:peptide/nickel transport system ATP-binding protein|nr:ATP-binding cassette domain-containing protein [Treponema sp.]